jgi:nucleoside-triphosphatase THEP1
VAVVVIRDPRVAAVVTLVALACAQVLDSRAVRTTLRAGLALAMVFAAAVTTAVVGWAQGMERGLESGSMVLLRLVVLATAAGVLARSVDADRLLVLSRRFGLERLGLVVGLALNTLPRIADHASQVWAAAAQRFSGRFGRLRRVPAIGEVLLAHTARIANEAAAAAALRGHRALTASAATLEVAVPLVVVTGPTNSGKTSVVSDVIDRLREGGHAVAGFIQQAQWKDGRKTGFTMLDLESGATVPLAERVTAGSGRYGTSFRFFREGFAAGQEALRRARAGSVVVVDELGPVELRGGGHMPAVRSVLRVADLGGIVVVVRKSLVPAFLDALEASDARVVDIENDHEGAVDAIVVALVNGLEPNS